MSTNPAVVLTDQQKVAEVERYMMPPVKGRMYIFPYGTHPQVASWIDNCLLNIRLRIWYGDRHTGRAWWTPDSGPVTGDNGGTVESGYIGRSTGTTLIPLLIRNSRSTGGDAIMADCIVKLEYANRKVGGMIWQHPQFHVGG